MTDKMNLRLSAGDETRIMIETDDGSWLPLCDIKCGGMSGRTVVEGERIATQIVELSRAALRSQPAGEWFQSEVASWMLECFTPEIADDTLERNDRFIEEALELVQSLDYSADRAHSLVEYVFNRPKGDPSQEVGGVMVTLAALCGPNGLDMMGSAATELARINHPDVIQKIRAKQASKPVGSALPIPPAQGGASHD